MRILGLVVLLLGGCKPDVECSEEVACDFGSTCVQGECRAVGCATSDQCAMEQFCDGGSCVEGCADDLDCYPGSVCDLEAASCDATQCEDTRRDCGYKEFCNSATGECYEAGGYYCKPCNDDGDCGGNGNYCTGYGYCGVTCESDADCPSGFNCYPFVDFNGNVQFYQCFTYCQLYEEYDSPPETKKTPPPVIDPSLPTAPALEAGP